MLKGPAEAMFVFNLFPHVSTLNLGGGGDRETCFKFPTVLKRFTEPSIKNLLAWSRGGVCVYLDRGGGGILQLGLSFRRCQKPKNKCCCPFGRCLLEVEVEGACGRWRWEEEVGRGGGRWRLEVGGLNKKGSGN